MSQNQEKMQAQDKQPQEEDVPNQASFQEEHEQTTAEQKANGFDQDNQQNQGADGSAQNENMGVEAPDFKEKYMRTMAEMENLRKRSARDVEDTRQFAVSGFAREMLDVADNLERALSVIDKEKAKNDPQLKTLIEGVEMVYSQLESAFAKFKIVKFCPNLGEKFNPEHHQAMFEVPTTEYPAGVVAQVMQSGYVIAGRLLRPAMVGTAKPPQESQQNTNNNS